ncbi:MAG: TIM barrel protein [Ruminococcus sp.]|nr:TIM barrel protein [Ruminococcus sp.]
MTTLIIPHIDSVTQSLALAAEYNLGYEYNDFYQPDILDDPLQTQTLTERYRRLPLPEYCTLRGAFLDVIPLSPDKKIRDVSRLRIEQSIAAAKGIGAKAVVFQTNYNPFLNSGEYIKNWIAAGTEYWKSVLSANEDINIYLANMFDNSPYIMAELAGNLSVCKNFGIALSYPHAALTHVPLREWVMSLGKFVRHVHINDNDFRSDLHLAVGEGKINWNEFYLLYEDYMKTATVVIETSSVKRQKMSLKKMAADGFLRK